MTRTVVLAVAAIAAAVVIIAGDRLLTDWLSDWPPEFGKPFPNIATVDHRGEELRISDFAGKVVLVHTAAMASPASNAYAGGHTLGGVGGIRPDAGVRALESDMMRFGNSRLEDDDLAVVHLLIYNVAEDAPDAGDAALWATHFRLDQRSGVFAAAPTRDLRSASSAAITPGIWLVDKRGFVRYAAAGRTPRHDLALELMPAIPALLGN